MKKFIFIISLIVLSFGFSKVSFAISIAHQLNYETSDTLNPGVSARQSIGTNLTGNILSISGEIKSLVNNQEVFLELYECNTSSSCFSGGGYSHNWQPYTDNFSNIEYTSTTFNTQETITSHFDHWKDTFTNQTGTTPISLNSNKYYALGIVFSTTSANIYGSNSSSSYTNGICGSGCTNIQDLFFIVNVSGTVSSSISITYPTNGSSINDFSHWNVRASGEIAKIKINYEDGFSSFSDTRELFVNTNGYANFSILKTHPLGVSTSSYKSATPYILDENNNITASGTTIYFLITGNATTTNSNFPDFIQTLLNNGIVGLNTWGVPYPNASSTQQCTWNSPLDCVTNAITQMFASLFTPHDISLNTIRGQLTQFSSIFPFSVPSTILLALENYSSSTPANLSFALPMPWATSTQIALLNSSTLTNTVGNTTKTSFFTFLNLIFYISTGVIILITIIK